jgi:cytochrome c5
VPNLSFFYGTQDGGLWIPSSAMFKIDTFTSAILGITFVLLGTATTFLMFWLWGFPFDKATRTSAAPKKLMILHRCLGFAFAGLYVFMMLQMAPRLVAYQVEFPPRTVAHICLGITVGFILLVKISIIRFFRHLEEWMPVLGVLMLLCTFLLAALSIPFSLRERQLARKSDALSKANLARVEMQLDGAGLPPEAKIAELATPKSLLHGREVLLTKCVACHDLRTVLTKPRTPSDWVKTVERMSERPVIGETIGERDQWDVSAYLVAISPDLQNAAQIARKQKQERADAKVAAKDAKAEAAAAADGGAPAPKPTFDAAQVKPKFEKLCTQCHELDDVEKHAWKDTKDVDEVLTRMVDNGLEASTDDLAACRWYVEEHYLTKK